MYLSEKASDPVSEKLWTDTGINNISEKSDEYLPENEDEGFLESADILQDSYDEPQDTNMYLFENKKDDFELLTAEQIAEETGIPINNVRKLFNDKSLAVQTYTKPRLVTRKAWNEFISERR